MPANQAIRNFYTWGSFLSLSVAAGAVWTVAGTLSYAFTWSYPRYFPLILAAVFSVMGDFAANTGPNKKPLRVRVPLWFLNACLIFTTAIGGSELAKGIPQNVRLAEVKRKTATLARSITNLQAKPGTAAVPKVQEAAVQVENLNRCLQGDKSAAACAEQHPLEPTLGISDAQKFPPGSAALIGDVQKKALDLHQDLAMAKGDYGFTRLGASPPRNE